MKRLFQMLLLAALCGLARPANAEVPARVSYQGRVTTGGTNFTGTGYFKFAVVDAAGVTNRWSNDGTAAGEPSDALALTVTRGLFAVQLGDTNLAHMIPLPPAALEGADLRLRLWFSDGGPFQLLTPDQPLGAVPFALMARGLDADANALRVGGDQLICVSNRVGVGTAAPASTLDIAGPGGAGSYTLRVSSGGKVIAWGREK